MLDFCALAPLERVFLEDVARRGLGRFVAVEDDGRAALSSLCHVGTNLVPSGPGCGAFADGCGGRRLADADRRGGRGDGALGRRPRSASAAAPGPAGPAGLRDRRAAAAGETGLRAATRADFERLLPACAAAHELELGTDPLADDPDAFRWRTSAQIDEGRSWLWLEDGVVRFKAEASAWTPSAVQIQQVWVDPEARGNGYASRGLRDLCRLLLASTPAVVLFVRRENAPAIALYDSIGMRRVLEYRSVLF